MARTVRSCLCGEVSDHQSRPEPYRVYQRAEAKGERKQVANDLRTLVTTPALREEG